MAILLDSLSKEEIRIFGLVLSASHIPYWVEQGTQGTDLYVSDKDTVAAEAAIEAYMEENSGRLRDSSFPERSFHKTYSALWACILLVFIHVGIPFLNDQAYVFRTYGASASRILGGELYRAVTALMLHSSPLHLTGNLVGLVVFGTALCGVTGWGMGWMMIIFSGAFGNLLNAFFYKTGHVSVGASTALFGAIGLVAVEHVLWKIKVGGSLKRAWLPLGGGLALLGFMGASQQSDFMAHFFGFLSGGVFGVLYATFVKRRLRWPLQVLCGMAAGMIVVGAWIYPLLF